MPGAGIEPARLSAGDFESPASTNFTTRAVDVKPQIMAQCEAMNYWPIENALHGYQSLAYKLVSHWQLMLVAE